MFEIGAYQKAKILRDQGEYFVVTDGEEEALLRKPRVLKGPLAVGDEVQVFVYRANKDVTIATFRKPKGIVGEFAYLEVKSCIDGGAFLDWGLDSDLFVPGTEQPKTLGVGRFYLIRICCDKRSRRVFGSAAIDKFILTDTVRLEEGQEVDVLPFAETDLGFKAMVNHAYNGLLYRNELPEEIELGVPRRAFIKKIREDGRLDLSLVPQGVATIRNLGDIILQTLRGAGGFLDVHDGTRTEEIFERFGVSKGAFKKSLGALYKQGLITIADKGIALVKNPIKRPPQSAGEPRASEARSREAKSSDFRPREPRSGDSRTGERETTYRPRTGRPAEPSRERDRSPRESAGRGYEDRERKPREGNGEAPPRRPSYGDIKAKSETPPAPRERGRSFPARNDGSAPPRRSSSENPGRPSGERERKPRTETEGREAPSRPKSYGEGKGRSDAPPQRERTGSPYERKPSSSSAAPRDKRGPSRGGPSVAEEARKTGLVRSMKSGGREDKPASPRYTPRSDAKSGAKPDAKRTPRKVKITK